MELALQTVQTESIGGMVTNIASKAGELGFTKEKINEIINNSWEKNNDIRWPDVKRNCFECQSVYTERYNNYLEACATALTNKTRNANVRLIDIFIDQESSFNNNTQNIPICAEAIENSANCGTVFMTIMDIMHIKFFLKFYDSDVNLLNLKNSQNMNTTIRDAILKNARKANEKLSTLGLGDLNIDNSRSNEAIIEQLQRAFEGARQKYPQTHFAVDYMRNEEYDDRSSEINKHAQNYHQQTDDSEDDSASFSSDSSHDYQSRWVR